MRILSAILLYFLSASAMASVGISCHSENCEIWKKAKPLDRVRPIEYSVSSHVVIPDESFEKGALKIKNVDSGNFSNFTALAAILISIVVPFVTHFAQKRRSFSADFFARQVLYPEYAKPLFEFMLWIYAFKHVSAINDHVGEEFDSRYSIALNNLSSYNLIVSSLQSGFDSKEISLSLQSVQDAFLDVWVAGQDSSSSDNSAISIDKLAAKVSEFNSLLIKSLKKCHG